MPTDLNLTSHIKAEFGSLKAFEEAADNSGDAAEFEFRHYLAWKHAICQEAGIPYHGWTTDAKRCALARKDQEATRWLHAMHNRATPSAFDIYLNNYDPSSLAYWLTRGIVD